MSWPRIRLDQCARIVGGATPLTSVPAYWDGDIRWVTPKDLSDLVGPCIGDTPRKITAAGLASCAAELLPAGSVLFSSRAPIGHVAITTQPMATNQGFKSLIPDGQRADAKYLYWWLRCHRDHMESLGNGATFKEVSKAIVSRVEIPLPPVDEQRRIAAILDQADALRRKRNLARRIVEGLPSLLFQRMFGDLIRNGRGWRAGKISELVKGFDSGKNLVAADEDDLTSVYRVLKVSAVTSLAFDPDETKALPRDYVPPEHHLVQRGDLLFSRANTSELIGATALVDCDCVGVALPDKVWRFRWHSEGQANPMFVWQLFMEPFFRDQIRRRATGTSGSMKNISRDKVLGIEIGIPEHVLQEEFARKFSELRVIADSMRQQQKAFDALFASLQHRAFRGEL